VPVRLAVPTISAPLAIALLACGLACSGQTCVQDVRPPSCQSAADTGARRMASGCSAPPAESPPAEPASSRPDQAAPPSTAPRSLSLQAALELARQRSFVLRQFDARVVGASSRLSGAGALPNPQANFGGHAGKDAGSDDEDYILSQTIELGDKRRQRVRGAAADKEAAQFDREEALADLAYAVKSAYFEAARADAALKLAQAAAENAKKFADAAQIQFTAGDVPRTQVMRSRVEQSRADQALAAATAERANRFATLASLLHLMPDEPLALADPLGFAPATLDLGALRALAAANRPDLRSADRARASRIAALHAVRAQTQPDLVVEARHSYIDPTVGGNTLRAGFVFPLIDFGRIRADAASARAAVAEQEAVIAETRRTALLEVDTAYRNLAAARAAVEAFQADRLATSKELVDLAQLGYSRGANTFLELLDAQQVYRSEQTDYARALADYNIALAALERAVGGRLP